jgi:hypothetical protein
MPLDLPNRKSERKSSAPAPEASPRLGAVGAPTSDTARPLVPTHPRGATFWPVQQHSPRLSASTCELDIHCWHTVNKTELLTQVWGNNIDESHSRLYGENRCCFCGKHASMHKLAQLEHGPYRPLKS